MTVPKGRCQGRARRTEISSSKARVDRRLGYCALRLAELIKVRVHEPFAQIPMGQTPPDTTPFLGSERLHLLGSPFPPVLGCSTFRRENEVGVSLSDTDRHRSKRQWAAAER